MIKIALHDLQYPKHSLYKDYAMAFVGVFLALLSIYLFYPSFGVRLFLYGVTIVFALFGVATLWRHTFRLSVDEQRLCASWFGREHCIVWYDISKVSFKYFAPRNKRDQGFFVLTLYAGRRRIKFDSDLSQFDVIMQIYKLIMHNRIIPMSLVTMSNLEAYYHKQNDSKKEGDLNVT